MQPLPDRLPLVIGVTGHRDLRDQDLPRLESEVAAVIERLRHDYLKGDKQTPIIVLSALAEGADRLVARVALAAGAHLIAPLPLPVEEYRRDFEPGLEPGNAAEFDTLLAQAIAAPVVGFTRGNSLAAVRADRHKRAEQYRAVGLFIIQHSNVLIALWDGDETNMAVGGTAEVIKFKREGIPLEASGSARASLDGSEIGPVIHVVAPRQKPGSPATAVATTHWGQVVVERHRGGPLQRALRIIPGIEDTRSALAHRERRELDAWESFAALVGLTRDFNAEAAALSARREGRSQTDQSLRYLLDDGDPQSTLPCDPVKLTYERAPRWSRLYALADVLAQGWQAQFKRDWAWLFVLAFCAFFCVALYSDLGPEMNPLLIAYELFYAAVFVVFLRARYGRHQERFLDYRALAEALRVAVFWRILGIGLEPADVRADALGGGVDADTVGVLANAYPIKQPNELAWVKISLRALELLDRVEGVAARRDIDPVCHEVARRCWVGGQHRFFQRRGYRHNLQAEWLERVATILLLGPGFLLLTQLWSLASATFGVATPYWLAVDRHMLVLVAIGLMPGVAAALTGYTERLALNPQVRQYDRMRELFERAYQLLPEKIDASTAAPVRQVYRELGIEAMKENAEWVAIYRQRPIQPLQQ